MAEAGTDWHARAAALNIDGRAFIDGARVDALDGATFDDHSPIDGRLLGRVHGRRIKCIALPAHERTVGRSGR